MFYVHALAEGGSSGGGGEKANRVLKGNTVAASRIGRNSATRGVNSNYNKRALRGNTAGRSRIRSV
jgi:hypothetical protein